LTFFTGAAGPDNINRTNSLQHVSLTTVYCSGLIKITIFKIKIESIDFLFKSDFFNLNRFFFIFIRFLHHSMLSVITNVLSSSVSLRMTVIGID